MINESIMNQKMFVLLTPGNYLENISNTRVYERGKLGRCILFCLQWREKIKTREEKIDRRTGKEYTEKKFKEKGQRGKALVRPDCRNPVSRMRARSSSQGGP